MMIYAIDLSLPQAFFPRSLNAPQLGEVPNGLYKGPKYQKRKLYANVGTSVRS